MRIHDAYSKHVGLETQGTTPAKPQKAHGHHEHDAGTQGHDSVKVNVSAKARALAAQADAGVDEAKVARLRDAIDKGTFKIDPQAIASKLVGPEE